MKKWRKRKIIQPPKITWLVSFEPSLVVFSCSQRPFCFLGKEVVLTEKKKNNPDLELNFELIDYLPK